MRPAICLTEPIGTHRHVVLAFVTSRQPDDALDSDIVLDPDDPDFGQTGLHVQSTVRSHRLLTVSSSLIKRELGGLSTERLEQVHRSVRHLFTTTDPPPSRESQQGSYFRADHERGRDLSAPDLELPDVVSDREPGQQIAQVSGLLE